MDGIGTRDAVLVGEGFKIEYEVWASQPSWYLQSACKLTTEAFESVYMASDERIEEVWENASRMSQQTLAPGLIWTSRSQVFQMEILKTEFGLAWVEFGFASNLPALFRGYVRLAELRRFARQLRDAIARRSLSKSPPAWLVQRGAEYKPSHNRPRDCVSWSAPGWSLSWERADDAFDCFAMSEAFKIRFPDEYIDGRALHRQFERALRGPIGGLSLPVGSLDFELDISIWETVGVVWWIPLQRNLFIGVADEQSPDDIGEFLLRFS